MKKACSRHANNNSNYIDLRHSDTWKHGDDGGGDDGGVALLLLHETESSDEIAKGRREGKWWKMMQSQRKPYLSCSLRRFAFSLEICFSTHICNSFDVFLRGTTTGMVLSPHANRKKEKKRKTRNHILFCRDAFAASAAAAIALNANDTIYYHHHTFH